jgi:hypothetical protein
MIAILSLLFFRGDSFFDSTWTKIAFELKCIGLNSTDNIEAQKHIKLQTSHSTTNPIVDNKGETKE